VIAMAFEAEIIKVIYAIEIANKTN